MTYYFLRELNISYDEVLERTVKSLKSEGFGVLTEIDVKETLKKKLEILTLKS